MTSSIQDLGNDAIKPATDNTMTLVKMVDIWSRMTPEQRDFVMVMHTAGFYVGEGVVEERAALAFIIRDWQKMDKELWDNLDLPFKFGKPALTK